MSNPVGRPLKFKTPEILDAKIEEYFASCWEEDWEKKPILNDNGKPTGDYKWVQNLDRNGKPLLVQTKPYTITGLAVYLDTSRVTLADYKQKPEFFNSIKRALDVCENYLEEGMLGGKLAAVPGIFSAKNNYGWVDKREHDHNVNDVTDKLNKAKARIERDN